MCKLHNVKIAYFFGVEAVEDRGEGSGRNDPGPTYSPAKYPPKNKKELRNRMNPEELIKLFTDKIQNDYRVKWIKRNEYQTISYADIVIRFERDLSFCISTKVFYDMTMARCQGIAFDRFYKTITNKIDKEFLKQIKR